MLCWPQAAHAHERIGSASHAIVVAKDHSVGYYLSIPPVLVKRLRREIEPDPDSLRDYFQSTLRVVVWDQPCELTQVARQDFPGSGNALFDLAFDCPQAVRDLAVTSYAFLDMDESHTQFIRLASPANPGTFLREEVLTAKHPTFHVPDVATGGSARRDRFVAFLKLGIEHLLTGYDHILFLLTVILGMRLMDTIKAVTSFTAAHSLTMALAFFGLVSLSSTVVEPAIALTVVYVAVENLRGASGERRWMLTFAFGLIHGLGFVGALKEITISRGELVLSLVSFNLGIELGQLLVIAIAVPALYLLQRYSWNAGLRRGFSAVAAGLGVLWLGDRLLTAVQAGNML